MEYFSIAFNQKTLECLTLGLHEYSLSLNMERNYTAILNTHAKQNQIRCQACIAFGCDKALSALGPPSIARGLGLAQPPCYCQHRKSSVSRSAATYLEVWKRGSRRRGPLNLSHSPVNYNPAFLISSPHTFLFIDVQTKHGPCRLNGLGEQTVPFFKVPTC